MNNWRKLSNYSVQLTHKSTGIAIRLCAGIANGLQEYLSVFNAIANVRFTTAQTCQIVCVQRCDRLWFMIFQAAANVRRRTGRSWSIADPTIAGTRIISIQFSSIAQTAQSQMFSSIDAFHMAAVIALAVWPHRRCQTWSRQRCTFIARQQMLLFAFLLQTWIVVFQVAYWSLVGGLMAIRMIDMRRRIRWWWMNWYSF